MRKIYLLSAILLALSITFNLLPFHWNAAAQSVDIDSNDLSSEKRSPEAAFTPGNIVVCRVGTGAAVLNAVGTETFLDEYTPTGTFVQSIPMPTATSGANQILTVGGSTTSECQINRSADGQYILVPGHNVAVGGAVGTAQKTIARVNAAGTVDTTTVITNGPSSFRSVTSSNGTDIWALGSTIGVVYTTFGSVSAGTVISTTITNNRVIKIFDGQLYSSDASGSAVRLGTIGTGLPTTSPQTITNLPGFPTGTGSPYSFFFADLSVGEAGLDTVYVADDGAAAGIEKYSKVSGTWTLNGTIAGPVRGITGTVAGSNVTLFTTTSVSNNNALQSVTDTSGYNAAPTGTPATLISAGTNIVFRGVAIAPQSAGGNPGIFAMAGDLANLSESATSATFVVNRTVGTTGSVVVNYTFGGTASGGTGVSCGGGDYNNSTTSVTFADGETTKNINVPLCDDGADEPNESITVTLQSATNGGTIGAPAAAAVTIVDDDVAPPAQIGGRVTNASGRGIGKAKIVVTQGVSSVVAILYTSSFGYYTTSALPSGTSYTVTVAAKGNSFSPNSQTFILNSDNLGVNFQAQP